MRIEGSENMDVLFKNDFLEVKWEADGKVLAAYWNGWLDSSRGHEGCELLLDFVKEKSARKMLNDNSEVTGASGDTSWLGKVWLPNLSDAGLLYFAWIYSPEFFTQIQVDKAIESSTEIEIQTFFAEEEARIWLGQFQFSE